MDIGVHDPAMRENLISQGAALGLSLGPKARPVYCVVVDKLRRLVYQLTARAGRAFGDV
jgi:hypothetical protein